MKLFTLFLMSALLSAATVAEEVTWPLIPEVANELQESNAEDLHTGGFYYYYLSEDYQTAYNYLKELRANDQLKKTTLDLLEATLLLALGLEEQALALYETVEQDTNDVPAKAWLYLARRLHAIGHWNLAERAAVTAHISTIAPLNTEETNEVLYLAIHSLVELQDAHRAKSYLLAMSERSKWTDLARHNILIGDIRGFASSYEIKRQVADAAFFAEETDEGQSIIDRSYLSAGIYLLEEGYYVDATALLSRVRQDSPYAAPALLELGWALLEQSKYQAAMQPWRELQTKYASWHPAVIESTLTVPHTMERINATTQALRGYERAEERIVGMLADLREQQQEAYIKQWIEEWYSNQQGDWGWTRHNTSIDHNSAISKNLISYLSDSTVKEQLDTLFDLKRIKQNLSDQLLNINHWQETAKVRQDYLTQVNGAQRMAALETRHARLTQQANAIEQRWKEENASPFGFADDEQNVQIGLLRDAVPVIKALKENAKEPSEYMGYIERWRRTRGLMVWNMSKERPVKERLAYNELRELRAEVTKLNTQLSHSQLALQSTENAWLDYVARAEKAKEKVKEIQHKVNVLERFQQQHIVAEIQENLTFQEDKLTRYLAQARLALARLYDDHLQQKLATINIGGEN